MIYLDSAATTKPYEEVVNTVATITSCHWANPSSNSTIADETRCIIEAVRRQFAEDLNCEPENIIFTSGGCESNSLAIAGFLKKHKNYEMFTTNFEHTSINQIADEFGAIKIPNNVVGRISHNMLRDCLIHHQIQPLRLPFVSISAASSETGTIQDIKSLAKVVHSFGGVLHCDAVQLFPEQRIDVKKWDVDMMSISAQKFHGPKGIGVLYVKSGIEIDPIIYGSQEGYKRGGTYNTAAIAGMGKALELTRKNNATEYVRDLRDRLISTLTMIPGAYVNGAWARDLRLANNISLSINGIDAEKLMTLCDLSGVVIARGSACQSHIQTPSKALLAMGLTQEEALSTVRITLDEFNTKEEIDTAANIIVKLVDRIRSEH